MPVGGYRFLGMPGNKKETCKKQISFGAGDEARTRYLHLGKVALYRMSYTRGTWLILAEDRENVKRNFSGTVNFFGAAAIPYAAPSETALKKNGKNNIRHSLTNNCRIFVNTL